MENNKDEIISTEYRYTKEREALNKKLVFVDDQTANVSPNAAATVNGIQEEIKNKYEDLLSKIIELNDKSDNIVEYIKLLRTACIGLEQFRDNLITENNRNMGFIITTFDGLKEKDKELENKTKSIDKMIEFLLNRITRNHNRALETDLWLRDKLVDLENSVRLNFLILYIISILSLIIGIIGIFL